MIKEEDIVRKMNQETEIAQEKEELILEPQALNTEDIKTNPTMKGDEDTAKRP